MYLLDNPSSASDHRPLRTHSRWWPILCHLLLLWRLMWRPDSSLITILSQASAAQTICCSGLPTISSFLCSQSLYVLKGYDDRHHNQELKRSLTNHLRENAQIHLSCKHNSTHLPISSTNVAQTLVRKLHFSCTYVSRTSGEAQEGVRQSR